MCLLIVAASLAPADVTGSWIFHLVAFGEDTSSARMEVEVDGDKVSGTFNELKLAAILEGDALKLKATRPDGSKFAASKAA